MLDIGFSEIALIVVVAFLVLGPKEFPTVIRALSRFFRQLREVVDECKAQLDDLANDTGLKDSVRYIKDESGQWRETYDISDILAEQKADAEHTSLPAPTDHKTEEGGGKP